MGWTLSERLFVLFEDGRLFLFSILGTQVAEIKLIEQAFTDLVSLGIATESGCIAYTRSGRLYLLFFNFYCLECIFFVMMIILL